MDESDDPDDFDMLDESFLKRFIHDKATLEKIALFKNLCLNASTKEEIFKLVILYTNIIKTTFMIKSYYNELIGWALPSQEAIEAVVSAFQEHLQAYPEARLVDFGAGSGIFSYMFEKLGIPKDKIIAVDLPKPTHSNKKQRNFYPIIRDDEYEVAITDILFIAWGSGCVRAVDSYVDRGGKCVIILGENDGCTFSSGYFIKYDEADTDDQDWIVEEHYVPAACSYLKELLTVNKRRIS